MSFGIPVRNGLGVGLLASTFLSSLRIGGRPAMSLDFIGTNSLDSRITFTRATTATFVGSNGLIQSAAINAPRFDYNPATLAPRGLLIEEARTNLIRQSEDFSDAIWPKNFGAGVTVLTNQANGPDGQLRMDRVTSAGAGAGLYQTLTLAFSTVHAVSVFIRQGTATTSQLAIFSTVSGVFVSVTFTWSGGVPSTSTSVGSPGNVTYENFGGGLYRLSFTFTSRSSGDHWPVYIPDTTAGLGTGIAGYAQLEAGGFVTSYIPTVASTVIRNADVATMTGTNFSSWFNTTQGTFVTSADAISTGANRVIVGGGVLTYLNYIRSNNQGGTFDTTNLAATANVITTAAFKLATTYGSSALQACLNGGAVASGSYNNIFASITSVALGSDAAGGAFLNGHIRAITYYNTRLPNATLQALTA